MILLDRPSPWRFSRGVSLIELMVGITIGLVLVTIVIRGFATTSGNTNVNSVVSEYQTNGRYALDVLKREVRHAALSPLLWEPAQLEISAMARVANFGCGALAPTGPLEWLRASNNANPYAASCLASGPTREYVQGDVLTLRRLGLDQVTPAGAFQANRPYARVSYGSGHLFLGIVETPLPLPAPSFDYPLVSDVYFINSFTNDPGETPRVPALYRLRLGAPQPELVASNVEHMQWQFGIDDGSGNVRFENPGATTDWANVVSAKVWLLVRATTPESGLQSGSYTMADVTYTPSDNFRRVVLSSTIYLRNR